MHLTFELGSKAYWIETAKPIDLAIPMAFDKKQPNFFGAQRASRQSLGSVSRGGSCNFSEYTLTPHCNGTHTECVGHILEQDVFIHDVLSEPWQPATLITVAPEPPEVSLERYPVIENEDLIISYRLLERHLGPKDPAFFKALVIRTLPNPVSKKSRKYGKHSIPPYFSLDALAYLVSLGVRHLLVDLPSVDRAYDGGKLANHRIFWYVPQGESEVHREHLSARTITELIYVPNRVPDGYYMLNLQIPAFATDAAPSRPFIYPVVAGATV